MAQVPTLHAPTTELDSTPLPYQRLQAPLEAFGGREAAQLQKAVEVGVNFKNLADESDANDALNQFRADNLKAANDFLGKQGKDAVDAHDAFVRDLNDRKQKTLSGLNFNAQRMLKSHLEGVYSNTLDTGATHFRRQQMQWSVDSSNATLDNNIKQGIAARNDPGTLQALAAHGEGEIDKLRPLFGWDDATTENRKAAWFTRFYGAVIANKAAQDPIGAQNLLNAVGDRLDPELRTKLTDFLKPRVDSLVVDGDLAKLAKTNGPDGKPLTGQAFIDAAGQMYKDPQRKFLAVTRARQMIAKDEQQTSQQAAQLHKQLVTLEQLYKAGDFTLAIPEQEIQRLFPAQAKDIIGSLKVSRMGGQMLKGLGTMSEEELAALYKDLATGRGKYSDEVRTYLGSIARATAPVAPRDFTNRYNTELTSEQESRFQNWADIYREQFGLDVLKDIKTYDVRGHYLRTFGAPASENDPKANGAPLGEKDQLNDFKKPNHPTFSSGSIYHGIDGYHGGEWVVGEGGKNTFIPTQTNIETMGDNGLQDYFQRHHPESALHLPAPTRSDFELGEEKLTLLQLKQQVDESIQLRNKALRANGMGYAIANDDMTRAAFLKASQSNNAKDWDNAIGLGMNFQRRLGVKDPLPMPQEMVNGMVTRFNSRDADPESKLRAVWLVTLLGDDAVKRAAIKQLTDAGVPESLPYVLQAAARGDRHDAYTLIEASRATRSPDLKSHLEHLKNVPEIAPYFTVYDLTSVWTGNQNHRKRGMDEAILAANIVRNGNTAAGAIHAVMGDQTPLVDRNLVAGFIPKSIDKYQALDGFDRLRDQLITPDSWKFATQFSGDDKNGVARAIADTAEQQRKNARWINFNDGNRSGYVMVLGTGGLMLGTDGKPLMFSIDEVLKAGEQAPKRVYRRFDMRGYENQYGRAVDMSSYDMDGRPR